MTIPFIFHSLLHLVSGTGLPAAMQPNPDAPIEAAGVDVHIAHASNGSIPNRWIRFSNAIGIVSTEPASVPSPSLAAPFFTKTRWPPRV